LIIAILGLVIQTNAESYYTPSTVNVSGYYRADGTYVNSYNRRPAGGVKHDAPYKKKSAFGGWLEFLGLLGVAYVCWKAIYSSDRKILPISEFRSLPNAKGNILDKSWLTTKISVEKAEKEHMVIDRRLGMVPTPFGFQNDSWVKNIISEMKPGDELWEFCNAGHNWKNLAGRKGIALVREGKIISHITTLMN